MGAGSLSPTCSTFIDDWLVIFSITLKVFKMMPRGALKI
jgi:hypothetical protein